MTEFTVHYSPCGSQVHLDDLSAFGRRGLPVAHNHSQWPMHSRIGGWRWCRALDEHGEILAGFAVQLTRSKALPGTHIGFAERIGRQLHAGADEAIGAILAAAAAGIPWLQRLDVQVYDEDDARREAISRSFLAAGAIPSAQHRNYTRTVRLDIAKPDDALMGSFSASTRRNIRRFLRSPAAKLDSIRDPAYASRMRDLYLDSFRRTEGAAPLLDVAGMLADAVDSGQSILRGVFVADRDPPTDLVAFSWGRLHGDYVAYDAGASERLSDGPDIAPGYALIWDLAQWGRQRGASWLDLGGVIAADAPSSHPLAGISSFKRRFTHDERLIAAEFSFTPNPWLLRAGEIARGAARLVGLSS